MGKIIDLSLEKNNISLKWLMLGIFALAISGLLSLILVFARAPILSSILPNILPFKTALIVHVDLSVLVWLLSITASIWCIYIKEKLSFYVDMFCYLAWAGVILIAISAFIPDSDAISNNYIPIISNFPFILGLSCFLVAFFCTCLIVFSCYLFNYLAVKDEYNIVSTSCFIMIIAAFCFTMSYKGLEIHNKTNLDTYFYYEMLFWGGGHILQFLYTQIACFIWLLLAFRIFTPKRRLRPLYSLYFFLNTIFTLPSIVLYWFVHIDDAVYTEFFTLQMKYLGGIVPSLIFITMLWQYLSGSINKIQNPFSPSLLTSIIVFFLGGFIGMLISGVNVVIPAHYHGSIVGISLAFMGYSYYYISQKFLDSPLNIDKRTKSLARVQPFIYGVGQILHIIGLWIAGGYGAMRKTPGLEIAVKAKLGMAIMGVGGIVAIIGGLMFVVICANSLWIEGKSRFSS
jgi:hypothetical protein